MARCLDTNPCCPSSAQTLEERVQDQGRNAVIETALRAASHICTSLFGYLATSFFSPEPLVTCILLIGIVATNIMRVMRARRRTKARHLSKRAASSHTLTRPPVFTVTILVDLPYLPRPDKNLSPLPHRIDCARRPARVHAVSRDAPPVSNEDRASTHQGWSATRHA